MGAMIGRIVAWVRLNLTMVICGSVAAVSVVAIVLGMLLPDVQASLQKDKSVYDSLKTAAGSAINEAVIEKHRQMQQDVRRRLQRYIAEASRTRDYVPVHPEVFPAVRPDRQNAPFEFRETVRRKQRDLLELLKAKDRPTDEEVRDYENKLKADAKKEERLRGGGIPAPGMPVMPGEGLLDRGAAPVRGRLPADGMGGAIDRSRTLLEIPAEQLIRENPASGLAVMIARSIYCYASPASLVPQPVLTEQGQPSLESMWRSQVSIWVQEDVIGALAQFNAAVADALPEDQRWVGHLPVKHLVGFTISSMQLAPAGGAAGGAAAVGGEPGGRMSGGGVSGNPGEVTGFIKRTRQPDIDVVRFQLDLVVEAPRLIEVLEVIAAAGFYTPTRVTYAEVPPNLTLTDYVYGPAPVIRTQVSYEGCLLRSKYARWIPAQLSGDTSGMGVPGGSGAPGGVGPGGGGGRFQPPPSRVPRGARPDRGDDS